MGSDHISHGHDHGCGCGCGAAHHAHVQPDPLAVEGKPFTRDQARGMLVGLAVGDALGAPLEFSTRGTRPPVTGMQGGGPFGLAPGQWTDDTSMALCLAHSLTACGGWDPQDAMTRFLRWRDTGYLSATGACFDIGIQTGEALSHFKATGAPYAGPEDEARSGNGGIMRLAPVVLAYGDDLACAQQAAQLQSRLTHGSRSCLRAAQKMAKFLVTGDTGLLSVPLDPPAVATGWVVDTLHAAHWALGQAGDFAGCLLAAVNLGGDADTVGAVTGQLAGRLFGYEGIPEAWRAQLWDHDEILVLADRLYDMRPAGL